MKYHLAAIFFVVSFCVAAPADKDAVSLVESTKVLDKKVWELVRKLEEEMGPKYLVKEVVDPAGQRVTSIEIHTVEPVCYTQTVVNTVPDRIEKSSLIITIDPRPSVNLQQYLRIRSRYYAMEEAFRDWEKKVSAIKRISVVPDGYAARDLFRRLVPATAEELRLTDEFKTFADACTEAEKAQMQAPTHEYCGMHYRVSSLKEWGRPIIQEKSLSDVLFADHVVSMVMEKLR